MKLGYLTACSPQRSLEDNPRLGSEGRRPVAHRTRRSRTDTPRRQPPRRRDDTMTSTSEQRPGDQYGHRLKLSLMMFLEFFIWGAWFVTMGTFLDSDLTASGSQISLAYLTQSLGADRGNRSSSGSSRTSSSPPRRCWGPALAGAGLLYLASTMETFGAFFPVILAT